jgi:hypothetical protein
VTTAERGQARAFLAENKLREIHQARENAKQPQNGVNLTKLGTHVFSLQETLARIMGLNTDGCLKAGKERKG